MGAHTFETYRDVDGRGAGEAYRAAVEDALYEYGHDGYNGTISTTSGCVLVTQDPLPMEAARRLAGQIIEDDERSRRLGINKWESAGAIPVMDGGGKPRERAVTVRAERSGYLGEADLLKLAEGAVKLRDGERMVSARVVKDEPRRRVEARATEGKAVTRYRVLDGGRVVGSPDGYDTQAQARKAARELIDQPGFSGAVNPHDRTLTVSGHVAREDGRALVEVASRVVSRRIKLVVSIQKVPAGPQRAKGYLFFGWAAS